MLSIYFFFPLFDCKNTAIFRNLQMFFQKSSFGGRMLSILFFPHFSAAYKRCFAHPQGVDKYGMIKLCEVFENATQVRRQYNRKRTFPGAKLKMLNSKSAKFRNSKTRLAVSQKSGIFVPINKRIRTGTRLKSCPSQIQKRRMVHTAT